MTVALVEQEPVFAYPVGAYTVMRVKADEPFTRKMIPEVVARAISFVETNGSETDVVWLGQLLYSGFFVNSNLIHVLVALDSKERIRAHSISYIEQIQGVGNVATILQAEKDIRGAVEITDLGIQLVSEWAKSLGVKIIRNWTATDSRTRLFEKYGFKKHRNVLQLNLD
jgi:hypothetical protein